MQNNEKFYSIEILRFMTAIAVLVSHYKHFFFPFFSNSKIKILENHHLQPFYDNLKYFYEFGIYGVPMFWTISGFVFAHVYLNKKGNFKEFFFNRFARLYPLHLLTLLIVFFLQFINFNYLGKFQIFEYNDLYHFILNFFFISGWGFERGYSFNNPIWSVSVEIVVYFIFYFSIIQIKKNRFKYLISISFVLYFIDQSDFNFFFSKCARLFFYGVIIYKINSLKILKLKLTLISIILLIIGLKTDLKTFFLFPSILLLFVSLENYFFKIRDILVVLGNQTYSIYLIHIPLQLLTIIVFSFFDLNHLILISNIFFLFFVILTMILSHITFKYFEKPLNIYIRNYFLKKRN